MNTRTACLGLARLALGEAALRNSPFPLSSSPGPFFLTGQLIPDTFQRSEFDSTPVPCRQAALARRSHRSVYFRRLDTSTQAATQYPPIYHTSSANPRTRKPEFRIREISTAKLNLRTRRDASLPEPRTHRHIWTPARADGLPGSHLQITKTPISGKWNRSRTVRSGLSCASAASEVSGWMLELQAAQGQSTGPSVSEIELDRGF